MTDDHSAPPLKCTLGTLITMKKLESSIYISIALMIAFLCGKYFAETREKQDTHQDPPRIFIEQLKTKMNITKNRNDIEIFLNGTKMTEDIKIDMRR